MTDIMRSTALALPPRKVALVAASLLRLSESSTANSSAPPLWSQKGHDAQRTGVSPLAGPTLLTRLAWNLSEPTGQFLLAPPSIGADDTVFAGVGSTMFALRCEDGTPHWSYDFSSPINVSATLSPSGDVVYIAAQDLSLTALNASDGALLWTSSTGDYVSASPVVSADGAAVYVASTDGVLYAFATADGQPLFAFDTGFPIRSSPVLSGEGRWVYVYSASLLYAIDTDDGEVAWTVRLSAEKGLPESTSGRNGDDEGARPKSMCAAGCVKRRYLGRRRQHHHQRSPSSGGTQRRGRAQAPPQLLSRAAFHANRRIKDGDDFPPSDPAISLKRSLLLIGLGSKLIAVSTADGVITWTHDCSSGVNPSASGRAVAVNSPAVDDVVGVVFIFCTVNEPDFTAADDLSTSRVISKISYVVRAISLDTAAVVWSSEDFPQRSYISSSQMPPSSPSSSSSPALARVNGILYVALGPSLYAINASTGAVVSRVEGAAGGGGAELTSPTIGGGRTVAVATSEGGVLVFGDPNGGADHYT